MKTKTLLFATICSALFFSACGNEDEPIVGTSDKQFTVKLKTDFDLVATRVASADSEKAITRTKTLLYNAAGELIGSSDVLAGNTDLVVDLTGGATTADVTSVYVLGNLTDKGDDIFQTDITDYTTKASVDNSHISVTAAGMQNEAAALPFAGIGTITGGTASVELKRKVARLTIKNETGAEISYEIENASNSFGGYMDPAKVTDDAPNGLSNIPSTVIGATKLTQNLYMLPNTNSAENKPVLKVTVNGTEKAMEMSIEANKVYTYTVRQTPASQDVTVTVTVEDEWADGGNGSLDFIPGETPAETIAATIEVSKYVSTPVALPAEVTSATGLTATGTHFSATFAQGTGEDAAKVMATVVPVRPYVTTSTTEKIPVKKDGVTVAYIDATQAAYDFEELTYGNVTFMDRELGATGATFVGELFALGALIPIDQAGASITNVPGKANFTGNGRTSLAAMGDLPFLSTTPWFANTDGTKNEATDPCPTGWHMAKLTELQLIFSEGNTTGNPGTSSGALNATLTYNAGMRRVTVVTTEPALTTVFNANTGMTLGSNWFDTGNPKSWPTGWWTSTKTTSGEKYYNLSFNFLVQGSENFTAQLKDNFSFNAAGKHSFQVRCVKD